MLKIFISVPMKGRTKNEIEYDILKMKLKAYEMFTSNGAVKVVCDPHAYHSVEETLEFINTEVKEQSPECCNIAIWYLGKSIELLSQCDVLVCLKDDKVQKYNGCFIEKEIAKRYGLQVVEVELEGWDKNEN